MNDEIREREVVLGYGGAWGFAPPDLTSPARAAARGAFVDSALDPAHRMTELRVHGVSGSNGPTMLEHPSVLQVAGDSTTMFYRRWSPMGTGNVSVPWKLEAYSWGGLTEKPLASAAWLLLTPFMLYNVAHFALPPAGSHKVEQKGDEPPRLDRDSRHARPQRLLRVLAFSATLQFTVAVIAVAVNTFALQAGVASTGDAGAKLPSWLKWFQHWTVRERISLGLALVAAVISALWWVSVKTASKYEARTTTADTQLKTAWPLTQPGFWHGKELVDRQRTLHAAGALALMALVIARPVGGNADAFRWVVAAVAAAVIVVVTATLLSSIADRHEVTLTEATSSTRTQTMGWLLLAVAGGSVIAGAFTGGWPSGTIAKPTTIPGFTNVALILLGVQVLLLVLLAVAVAFARDDGAASPKPGFESFFRGHLTTLLAVLAVCFGGMLSALLTLFATRLVGAPVPSGTAFDIPTKNSLQIPWPIYAFAAAPLGVLVAGLFIVVTVVATRRTHIEHALAHVSVDGRSVSRVAAHYADGELDGGGAFDGDEYKKSRGAVARAWAVGQMVDQAGVVAGMLAAGMVIATAIGEVLGFWLSHHETSIPRLVHGFVSLESLIGLAIAGGLVAMLRNVYSKPGQRNTIGALWDVGTFWPRAAHPFAPPCYAERAVPELVDRIRILTGTVDPSDPSDPANAIIRAHERNASESPGLALDCGPLLLTGYSQGAVIAPAVIAQLPAATLDRVALLTLACPARRLYGRAFPGYFGGPQLDTLAGLLHTADADPARRRWKNLVRKSDYIGSWVIQQPQPTLAAAQLDDEVDQPCWDPVSLALNSDPTPPPIHYHSAFFQDPRTVQVAERLSKILDTVR